MKARRDLLECSHLINYLSGTEAEMTSHELAYHWALNSARHTLLAKHININRNSTSKEKEIFFVQNTYGAPNGPTIKYLSCSNFPLSWLHLIWLFDFTRHKYCLSSVNTDTKLGHAQNSVDDTKLGRWHKTRSITQNSVDDANLARWRKSRSMAQNSVHGTKLGRWRKSRSMAVAVAGPSV